MSLQFLDNDSNHYKFTGKERDSETGLDYFGARYYSNGLSRFLTPDWAAMPAAIPYAVLGDPQSLNLYTYVRGVPTSGVDLDGHCDNRFCQAAKEQLQIQAGVVIGTAKFVGGAIPGVQAVQAMRSAIHVAKAGNAGMAAQAHATINAARTVNAAAMGNEKAATQILTGVNNAWNNASMTDKASALTQVTLTAMSMGAGAGISGPSPSLVGFSEGESAMIGQSLRNLRGAGYDTSAFQQLVRSTDMPEGTWGISLSTSPTGAALGDGAFTSQEMLDHTMEEELRHLGQDLSNQSIGRGDAAAKEAEVDANRKFPEPKRNQ